MVGRSKAFLVNVPLVNTSKYAKMSRVEPILQSITGEAFDRSSANTLDEARLDISARSFWIIGQRAFFDISVLGPNAQR